MNFEELLNAYDRAISENNSAFAEELLQQGIREYAEKGDDGSLLRLLNEYLGFLRELGRSEESYKIAAQILALSEYMGLKGSIPYATSLLNIANAYRAGGRLNEAMELYDEVETIYGQTANKNPMLVASFYNNKSLLYQEMGQLTAAVRCLETALEIVLEADEKFEIAVTYTNLANSYVGLKEYEKAFKAAREAKDIFEVIGTEDGHYASALYVLGLISINAGRKEEAGAFLTRALRIMETTLGRNEFYYRIKDELERANRMSMSGLEICRAFYKEVVAPGIAEKFPEYADKIAAGLIGRGSDCYGYDDEFSRDHDWGPGCLLFVSRETYDAIGNDLEDFYCNLSKDFMGYHPGPTVSSNKRRGVFITEEFYINLLQVFPVTTENMQNIQDYSLSSAVNGEVFADPEGTLTSIRLELMKGYPEPLLYLKIAEEAAKFSQGAQYNYKRFMKRGDTFTASIMLADGLKAAMRLAHFIENKYPPHDKWLRRSCEDLEMGSEFVKLLLSSANGNTDELGAFLATKLYERSYISDTDDYLDHHVEELLLKSKLSAYSNEELTDLITKLEFEAFDKVQNEGGRAYCQDDFYTFSIMRKSQYITWSREMLLQYYYDFNRELKYGHNLITEKYGRMMLTTAPKAYEKLKGHFPDISEEKSAIIEAIIRIQVEWMEDFAKEYPKLAGNARSIHTYEDTPHSTSYETYLRGEISTYSDKMLQLYGRYVAKLANDGKNLAKITMENSCKMYGYAGLLEAEQAVK